jgi:isoleucyl-tRNA synthetase
MDYKDTLHMPKTDFPMRGNLGQREPEIQKRWDEIDLYGQSLAKNEGNTPFVLHDGPPYANGDIHTGHTLNKILKDFVLRYETMKGSHVRYVPGWDTHGLPIETALAKKGVKRKEMSLVDYRRMCRDYALTQVERQKEQFKRLGILGEWDEPYITLNHAYEADQIRMFAKMVDRGLIYKGLKPVYWSPSSESALAEAEIEYLEKESTSIYVAFPLVKAPEGFTDTSIVIWTTTPWTIPANLATSVHPRFDYVHVKTDKGLFIVARTLLESLRETLGWTSVEVLSTFKGSEMEHWAYRHPLYDRTCPVICGEHVTDTDGTGLVHTAPGHGEDDYRIGKTYGLEIFCPVDDHGVMTEDAGPFAGMAYDVANEAIVDALDKEGVLLRKDRFKHQYPHDWRTGKPVIFRATPQWFASIDKLKDELMAAVREVNWLPRWGEVRLSNMIEGREDWCISRQRAWGVPIPVFYAEDGEPILDSDVLAHVADLFGLHGSDVWYDKDAKDLLPEGYTHPGSPNGIFKKETDIMDVWFDSGTSHAVLQRRGLPYPSDLYLEGSDQYRGWFNSSLTTGVAAYGKAPYKKVISHGFVLDGQGRKMSKSLGNAIDPIKLMNAQGADLLRLWVASVDYQSDVRISDDLMRQIAESYRKIRNTFRFMLGNLEDFDPVRDHVGMDRRSSVDKVMWMKYVAIERDVLSSYENAQFDRVKRLIEPFMINDLSAFYLDYTKDILYIENRNALSRRAVQSTMYDITTGLLKLLTPIIPHTTSEAYGHLQGTMCEDVYLERFTVRDDKEDVALMADFERFESVREVVLKSLEEARADKVIGKSLQARLELIVTTEDKAAIDRLSLDLKQVLMVSSVDVSTGGQTQAVVAPAHGPTCDRCWNVVGNVNEEGLCARCAHVLETEDHQ